MNISSVKNVTFKGEFVLNNLEQMRKHYPFKSCTIRAINIAKRDGLKCHCCGSEGVFKLHDMYGMIMFAGNGRRMTVDHNLLNSLEGSNMLHNLHLLCEKCNLMRSNLFAEYAEFKYWYDRCLLNNLNPNAEINKVKRNFTYLDLSKNGFKREHVIKLPQVLNSTMPGHYKLALINHYNKHNQFIPALMPVKLKDLVKVSNTAWDEFINEFAKELINIRICKEVIASNKGHGIINNKSKKNMETLCNKLNHIVKAEYSKHRDELKKQNTETIPEKETIQVLNVTEKRSLWTRLLTIFTKNTSVSA